MPYKDPEKRRQRDLRQAAVRSDRYHHDQEFRQLQLDRQARWRAENPQKARDGVWRSTIKKLYDLTAEGYEALLAAQGGGCSICSSKTPGGFGKRFHVDHDHETKKVRGLLCHHCNTGIGHLRHDPELLLRAVDYLAKPPAQVTP